MKQETATIISQMQEVLSGEPWYGKSFLTMLSEIDPSKIYQKPNENAHSMIELLYHMITWAEFTQFRLQKNQQMDAEAVEKLDWRETNAQIHTWNNGIAQYTAITNKINELLEAADDELLEEKVDFRTYNFRYLLNGLIQHTIYHLGQIAYLNKLLPDRG